ncbi:tetratricopeptide repeat protein [Actinoplanes sp. NPDC049118]|uniref:tetratricopeptide repeat protein n=1 Tax=Actinoplanes sp. NPDC049118 TaxID=3155769 RepID=UPI0033D7C9C6
MIIEPLNPEDRADWLIERGRVDEAITVLEGLARDGDDGDLYNLTALLVEQGRVEEAETHWRAAVSAGLPGAHGGLAALLAESGRTGEALAGWRAAMEAGEPHAWSELARLLGRAGRVDEAIAEYRAMIAGGDAAAGRDLAKMYARADRPDDAIGAYRRAIDAAGVARWPLGALFERFGRLDEAVAAYRDAVAAGEEHVRYRLIRALASAGRLAEATAAIQESGGSRRSLGWLLAEQRRFAELEAEACRLKGAGRMEWVSLIVGAQRSANYHDDCPADCEARTKVVRELPQ